MTREARSVRCPESVLGWIPWYGEGTEDGQSLLSPRQRGAVEAHAAECADCRAELDMIAGGPFELDVDLPDPDRLFEQITARIEAGECEAYARAAADESASRVIPIDRGRPLGDADYARIAQWVFDDSSEPFEDMEEAFAFPLEDVPEPPSARPALAPALAPAGPASERPLGPHAWQLSKAWAAAAAIVLFVLGGLAGGLLDEPGSALWPGAEAAEAPVYELASADPAVDRPSIDVVFAASAPASEISRVLRSLDLEIVSGPSSLGVYRLRPRPSVAGGPASAEDLSTAGAETSSAEDVDAAALAARLSEAAASIVLFAEPVP